MQQAWFEDSARRKAERELKEERVRTNTKNIATIIEQRGPQSWQALEAIEQAETQKNQTFDPNDLARKTKEVMARAKSKANETSGRPSLRDQSTACPRVSRSVRTGSRAHEGAGVSATRIVRSELLDTDLEKLIAKVVSRMPELVGATGKQGA